MKKIYSSLNSHFMQQPKDPLDTRLVSLHDQEHNLTTVREKEWRHLVQTLLQITLTALTTKAAEHKWQGQRGHLRVGWLPQKPALHSPVLCKHHHHLFPKCFHSNPLVVLF